MAHVIIGGLSSTLQPGATLSYESDGTITGTARFADLQGASPSPIGGTHPDDIRAVCVSYTLEYDECFLYSNCVYRGVWSTSATKVDVQASLSANPIETHPNFVSTLGGSPGAELNGAVFDTNGVFLGWPAGSSLGLGGVRYYLAAGCSIRFTTSTTSGSAVASALASIGSISSSITGGGSTFTTAYTFPGFMLQNVTVDWQYLGSATTIYTYSLIYVMTQPPGWNSNIYPP
jgi:hypothetical protein